MVYKKLIVLVGPLIGFVNTAFASVGGLGTLNVHSQAPVKERMSVVAYKFNLKSLILPVSLITVGAVGTAIDGMNDFHPFSRRDSIKQIRIDNYSEWGMLGWVFVCDLMGKEKHNWVGQLCLVVLAEGMNGLMVHGLKNWVNEPRPDGAPCSFPSGYTPDAFLEAHMAYRKLKDGSPILAYSGYAIMAFVAGSCLYNSRYWVADTVAGADFGILSVELSYLIHFPIRDAIARRINRNVKNCPIVTAPVFSSNMAGFYLTYRF